MARTIMIKCPICEGLLEVDVVTKQVWRHFEKSDARESGHLFNKAVEKVKTRKEKAEEVYESAQERLRKPKKSLDEYLKDAKLDDEHERQL